MIHLAKLPYPKDALEPILSARCLETHHDRIEAAYVNNANLLIKRRGEKEALRNAEHRSPVPQERYEKATLDELALDPHLMNDGLSPPINRCAQLAWAHRFFWESLCPPARRTSPPSALLEKFESVKKLGDRLLLEAEALLSGPGWAWVIHTETNPLYSPPFPPGKGPISSRGWLHVVCTHASALPQQRISGARPLLGIDLWEHAYYDDFRDDRERYVHTLLEKLIDWDRVRERLQTATQKVKT